MKLRFMVDSVIGQLGDNPFVVRSLRDLKKPASAKDRLPESEFLNFSKKTQQLVNSMTDFSNFLDGDHVSPLARDMLPKLANIIRENTAEITAAANLVLEDPTRISEYEEACTKAKQQMEKCKCLLAKLGQLQGDQDDMDLGDLLDTAGNLAKNIKSLSVTTPASRSSSDSSDSSDDGSSDNSSLLLSSKPLSFALSAEKAARKVREANTTTITEAMDLADALSMLSKASSSNDKKGMMAAAKISSENIRRWSDKLRKIAQQIPGKNMSEKKEQDQMYRWAEALDNMAVQLRILVSVKASSSDSSTDTTESSLVAITTTLGEVVKASQLCVTRWL